MKTLLASNPNIETHFLGVGEGRIFRQPTLSQTVLGSCVSVTFHCPRLELGGITHALMPVWSDYESRMDESVRYKFVDSGIEGIYELFANQGARLAEIECKVFGGATSSFISQLSVAQKNVKTAFETLTRLKLRIAASHVGGSQGRKLFFFSNSGDVFVKYLKTMNNNCK
ncbi:MAG: chemotaxis protein CheD [Desulfovibrionaceae bacterium]|nr:chemotaxis protein CheD [Desulfovibrionaceae bacterium]MBF0514035.1 chemotaxis protein CheD [Desulfovibrionaceae bacterium]